MQWGWLQMSFIPLNHCLLSMCVLNQGDSAERGKELVWEKASAQNQVNKNSKLLKKKTQNCKIVY